MRSDRVPLSRGQRIGAVVVGIGLMGAAWALAALVRAEWRWMLAGVLALAGLLYLRAAALGHVAARDDAPAPEWLRRAARRWLAARWRND